jgi:putative protease
MEGKKNCVTPDELKEVVSIARDNNIKVNYAANVREFVNELIKGTPQSDVFLRYLDIGINAGVDAVILGNMSAILLTKEHGYTVKVHSSNYLNAFNKKHILHLHELGVRRVILPYNMMYQDLTILSEHDIEVEIFGHFSCSNVDGLCFFIHCPTGKNVALEMPCRYKWNVTLPDGTIASTPFMDSALDCSVCSLPKLIHLDNVVSFKIVGRDIDASIIAAIVKVYRACIDMAYQGSSVDELRDYAIHHHPFLGGCVLFGKTV